MTEKDEKDQSENKSENEEAPLPFCTTAPAPEHQRAFNQDEPCDDARAGNVEEQEPETD